MGSDLRFQTLLLQGLGYLDESIKSVLAFRCSMHYTSPSLDPGFRPMLP